MESIAHRILGRLHFFGALERAEQGPYVSQPRILRKTSPVDPRIMTHDDSFGKSSAMFTYQH